MKRVLILAVLLIAGCAGPTKTDSSAELLKPLRPEQPVSKFAQEWVAKYGDSLESIEHYNIALARQILNNQGLAVDKLRKRVEALEAARKELADAATGKAIGEMRGHECKQPDENPKKHDWTINK